MATNRSPPPLAGALPRLAFRLWKRALAHPLVALLAVGGLAAAAITVTYTNSSTLSTSVTPAPVQFVAGNDAGPSALSDYVTAYTISNNKTYFTSTIKGVPEASLVVDSFVKIQNVDDASHGVTLTTPQVSNAYVTAYTLAFYNSANTLQSTLTLTAASPSASLTIPAGETFYGKLTLTLATGAGTNNVALTNSLSMAVS